ncbi:MAG TPA: GGDEF domain-containing protein [Acidimicrobiales bacterium]|nr:GGDEF domain-containing protein [Acidimicrobiales bacterium]
MPRSEGAPAGGSEGTGGTPPTPGDDAAIAGLARAWARRCEATGCAIGAADEAERWDLLVHLESAATADAVARVRGAFSSRARSVPAPPPRSASTIAQRRKALEGAAARWGACIASPTVVVEQLLLLRHLVTISADGERLGRLVDRVMLVATKAATDELQTAAFTDALTGCANRRAFERDLERELARCARAELDLCLVALDLDGLKHINDSEGHAAGDRALLQLVESLRRALRTLDGVYRLGGDEFVVVLPDTSLDGARVVMARVERLGAPAFTWGVASVMSTGIADSARLVTAADDALYDRRRVDRDPRARGRAGGPDTRFVPDLPEVPAGERRPISDIGQSSTA